MPIKQPIDDDLDDIDQFDPDRAAKLKILSASCPLCASGVLIPLTVKGHNEDLTFYLDQCVSCKIVFTQSWVLIKKTAKPNSWQWKSLTQETKQQRAQKNDLHEVQEFDQPPTELGFPPSHDMDRRTDFDKRNVDTSEGIEFGSDSNNGSRQE